MSKLEKTLQGIRKRFGEGAIFNLGEDNSLDIERVPSGSIGLDIAIGGGIPVGRIVEIYGPESSGKTTVCQHIAAEFQKIGSVCGYIDMEHALDPNYANMCGVDVENLYISQPDTGEEALEIAQALIEGGFGLVVIDSVAALVPRAELDGEMGQAHMGLQARLMSQACRKLSPIMKKNKSTLIFTNQLRHKIGVMFGSPETTSGGNALKFYSSIRLDIRRIQAVKLKGEIIGNLTRIKVKKNKVAPPFKECEFEIYYGSGISKSGEIRDFGIKLGLIQKNGTFYKILDSETGEILLQKQGRVQFAQELENHSQLITHLENEIKKAYFNTDTD